MIRAGLAWHYKRFDSTPAYAAAETEARQNHRGLWSDPNPTPPEDFRYGKTAASSERTEDDASPCASNPAASHPKEMRHLAASYGRTEDGASPCVSNPAASSKRVEYRASSALPVSSRTAAPINDTYPDTGYWLSTNSNKRHNRKCENYRKTRGYPCSSSDGTPCGKCGG